MPHPLRNANLFLQQSWIIRLRWIAGSLVLAGGLTEKFLLHWYDTGAHIALLGLIILAVNTFFALLSRHLAHQPSTARDSLRTLVWTQILADLLCLTLLTSFTGNYDSPLRALFVCHMVFAALLFNRVHAIGVAFVAIGMVEGTLLMTAPHAPTRTQIATSLGWDLTLLATIYLAGRIAHNLRTQRRRLVHQNRRIRDMSQRLGRQQLLMIQQEKMIAMGQMAAGVAHEVANPLASMDGLLQLLERRPEKVSAENIARLRQQIARVTGIVRQLTDFAHPGGEWQDASLNDVVDKALEVLRFDRRLKRAKIEKHLDPAIPVMRIQPDALEQVIINIAINAGDAMDAVPAPALQIRTQLVGNEILLSIADNGIGIPPDIRDRIFEPFFTTKPVGKGTGLGLSISYSLVRKHEGRITLDSAPNIGTTFKIHLPVVTLPLTPPPPSPSHEKEAAKILSADPGNPAPN